MFIFFDSVIVFDETNHTVQSAHRNSRFLLFKSSFTKLIFIYGFRNKQQLRSAWETKCNMIQVPFCFLNVTLLLFVSEILHVSLLYKILWTVSFLRNDSYVRQSYPVIRTKCVRPIDIYIWMNGNSDRTSIERPKGSYRIHFLKFL